MDRPKLRATCGLPARIAQCFALPQLLAEFALTPPGRPSMFRLVPSSSTAATPGSSQEGPPEPESRSASSGRHRHTGDFGLRCGGLGTGDPGNRITALRSRGRRNWAGGRRSGIGGDEGLGPGPTGMESASADEDGEPPPGVGKRTTSTRWNGRWNRFAGSVGRTTGGHKV